MKIALALHLSERRPVPARIVIGNPVREIAKYTLRARVRLYFEALITREWPAS